MNIDFSGLEKRDLIALIKLFTECDDERADANDALQVGIQKFEAAGAWRPLVSAFGRANDMLVGALQAAVTNYVARAKAGERDELVYLDGLVKLDDREAINLFDLSDDSVAALLGHEMTLSAAMFGASETLIRKLTPADARPGALVAEWVSVMNEVRERSNAEVRRILSARPHGAKLN